MSWTGALIVLASPVVNTMSAELCELDKRYWRGRDRAEGAPRVSAPRSSRASQGSDEPRLERGLSQGREAPLPPPPPPPGGPSPPRAPLSANARARLDALDADERDALAAVRADYAARRDALRAELEAAANEGAP